MKVKCQQIGTLAGLTALEMIRQPATLLISLSSVVFVALLPLLITHTMGEPGRLVRDSALAVQFSVGLILAAYCACATFSSEIRTGTAGSILSKPISRDTFFLAKFIGVGCVLVLYQFAAGLTTLLSSRGGAQSFFVDWWALVPLYGAILLALAVGGGINYIRRTPFVSAAFIGLICFLALGFFGSAFFNPEGEWAAFGEYMNWQLVPAVVLITLATLVLAALSVTLATRLELIPTITFCFVVFCLGLVSDYLFGRFADESRLRAIAYAFVPNWQHFWTVDALSGDAGIPWGYVMQVAVYAVLVSAALLSLGLCSFRNMDVMR